MIKQFYQRVVPFETRTRWNRWLGKHKSGGVKDNLPDSYLFFKTQGALFIHIPKTAGISAFHALFGRDSFGHIPFASYEQALPQAELKKLYTFAFVRHPIDRFISAYVYLEHGGRGKPIDKEYQQILQQATDIEDFVLNHFGEEFTNKVQHFLPQATYVLNAKGNIGVDFVGRFETLHNDLQQLASRLGRSSLKLTTLNQTNTEGIELSQEAKGKLQKLYRQDFELFNYA